MLRRFFLIGIVLVAGVVVAPTASAVILDRTLGSAEIELRAGADDFQTRRTWIVSNQRVGKQVAGAVERARHGNADMLKAATALVLDGAVETRRDDF